MEPKSPGSKKPSHPPHPYLFPRPLRKKPTNTGPTSPGSIPAQLSPIHHKPEQNQEQQQQQQTTTTPQLEQHQRSTPPLPPTWPAPPMTFPQFDQLPAEVRQMIWALYLAASPRIHVVHETGHAAPPPPSRPVPLQRAPRAPDDAQVLRLPLYHIATLDASTNRQCRGLRSPNVNVECREMALRLGMLDSLHSSGPFGKKAAFWLARDLQMSASERRRLPPPPSPQPQQQQRRRRQRQQQQLGPSASRTLTTTTRRGEETEQQRGRQELFRPVHVDWAEDLIYICSASNERGFRNLAETPWASQIQRLAVLVPRRCESSNNNNNTNNSDGNGMMPFGAGYRVAQVLRPMVSLRELYVVMIPLVQPAPRPTGPGNSCWGRDRYGFVNYVDYLREVGISGSSGSSGSTATTQKETMRQECHLTYQRTTLSMVQALAGRLDSARVKVRKVVDVDCKLFTESAYERRTRWTGIKPSKD